MSHPNSGDAGIDETAYENAAYDSASGEEQGGMRVEYPSRACDACRKMKIRCIDKENPPCKRCRRKKLQCKFAMPPMPRAVLEENQATKGRLSQLEGHVAGIYQKLDDMSTLLLRFGSNRTSAHSPSTIGDSHTPHTQTSTSLREATGMSACPPPPVMPAPVPAQHSIDSCASHNEQPQSTSHLAGTWAHAIQEERYPPQRLPSGSDLGSMQRQPSLPLSTTSDQSEDDPLESAIHGEPFRHFTKREEEINLRAQGHGAKRSSSRDDWGGRDKKRRIGQPGAHSEDNWIPSPIREKGDALRHSADPITTGLISEAEGKLLFDAFFQYAHPFTPVFDPREDTFDSLRRRSPFCMTVIMLVALKQREATGPPSELSKVLKQEVETMSKQTLFSPIATLETVQGLAILISYSDNAWRLCCHALALAVDMRLYRCLPYLHKIRADSQHPDHLLERQRPLVVGARLWLGLLRLAYEMSYNHALPVLFPSPPGKRNSYARELLEHPLSTLYDSRLVVSLELCEVRECAFQPYESVASQDQAEMDRLLREANNGIDVLYEYWLEYYERLGLPADHFLCIELSSQRAYSIMFTNSPAWYGVQKKEDVKLLSADRQQWVSAALRSAAFLVSSVANKRLEKDSAFGNHNFHVGIVATARYLIRMCELLPEVGDRFQISLDIDRLLLKLPYYPVRPFADGLRRTLAKAREQKILPFTQMSEAASRPPVPSPQGSEAAALGMAAAEAVAQFPGFNPFPWQDPVQTTSAEASSHPIVALPNSHSVQSTPWPHAPDNFDLAAWFPPPDPMLAVDTTLDMDMTNWFPAAPQVLMDL